MKLWIRSQDKRELKEVEALWLSHDTIHNHNNFNMYEEAKTIYTIIADEQCVGRYETQQRALEVLDEIQNALVGKVIVEPKQSKTKKEDGILEAQPVNIKPLNQNCVVYQMPEK